MYISDMSIRRPVFTTMMAIALIVLGVVSYNKMNVDLYPEVDFPFVIVTTAYPGAGPEAVASDVTRKVEDALNPIAGVKHIQSTSMEGVSFVFTEFSLETDGIVAAQEVREKISSIRSELPKDVEDPIVQRYDPSAAPIMSIVMGGDLSIRELTSIADKLVKEKIESMKGVGSIEIIGGSEREFQVLLDLDAVNARKLTYDDIISSISNANFEVPAGHLNQGPTEMLVRTMGRFENLDDIKSVIVKNDDGKIIRLKDIANVIDTVAERRSLSRFNHEEAVTLQVRRQSGANTVETALMVTESLNEINDLLPSGVIVEVARDNSVFIEESLHDVQLTIFFGGALAIFVIFMFLANIQSTIISAIAIPVSIVATFTAMNFLGFTLNMMSLLALSLAVGLLIDDAIVVIENIYRHIDKGETPFEAAKNGTAEIGLAVMATTFAIVVVFMPVAFMSGIVGRFFYQFGLTIAVAVLVSLFVAFTLTPMLSSKFLKKEKPLVKGSKNPVKIALFYWNRFFKSFGMVYKRLLGWTLQHRFITLVAAACIFLLSMYLGSFLGADFLPKSDRSEIYISFQAMAGSSLDRTSDLASQLEKKIADQEIVKYQLTTIGGEQTSINEGRIYVKLVEKSERDISVFEFVDFLRVELAKVPGLTVSIANQPSDGGSSRQAEYSIRGPEFDRIKSLAASMENILKEKVPGTVDVDNSEKQSRPELQIEVDREMADDLGLNLAGIGLTVRSMIDGSISGRFKEGDEEYDIVVKLAPEYRTDLENIRNIKIASSKKVDGEDLLVSLRQVAAISEKKSPTEIKRFDRQREIRVGANAETGYSLGDIIDAVAIHKDSLNIRPGYTVAPVGESELMADSFADIIVALVLAVIFIYLLLASQFESFTDPLAMGMSLAMAPVGAIIMLLVFGSSWSIMSMIGIIFLMGLVTKNAILLIDFIKQARAKGLSRTDAILQAGPIRLRPIMMTSLSMIFAMMPVAFGIGPGAEFRAPMAQAVIGGLTSSTFLTLILVPVAYTILDDLVIYITRKMKEFISFFARMIKGKDILGN